MGIRLFGLDEHFLPWTEVKVTGVDGYAFAGAHPDVNGKWGGHRALVAHYQPNSDDRDWKSLLYILVGDYWKVGNLRGFDDMSKVSRFEVFKALLEAMEAGVDPDQLYTAIMEIARDARRSSG